MSFLELYGVGVDVLHGSFSESSVSIGGVSPSVNNRFFDTRAKFKRQFKFALPASSQHHAESMMDLIENRFFKIPFSNGLGGAGGFNPLANGYSNMQNINIDTAYSSMKIEGLGATLVNNASMHYDFRSSDLTICYYHSDATTQGRYFAKVENFIVTQQFQPTSSGNSWTIQTLGGNQVARYQQASGARYIADCVVFQSVVDNEVLSLINASRVRISEHAGVVISGEAIGGRVVCDAKCEIAGESKDNLTINVMAVEI
jgi:hypothetical protein